VTIGARAVVPREDLRGVSRERILSAAATVMEEVGWAALSMSEVAAQSGFSRSTVHRYFSTRQDLARALQARAPAPGSDGPPAGEPARKTFSGPPTPRGQGRRLLLDAARELFLRKGYSGTSVREIADLANVSQPMLYRHFESKAALFEEAAIVPLNDFLIEYVAEIRARPRTHQTLYAQSREFCASLYDFAARNRDLLFTILATRQSTDVVAAGADPFHRAAQQCLELIAEALGHEVRRRDLKSFDVRIVARLVFSTVLSTVLYQDWLIPAEGTREHVLDEMATLFVHGIGNGGDPV
jgi:AcrR family transcriptional regulator